MRPSRSPAVPDARPACRTRIRRSVRSGGLRPSQSWAPRSEHSVARATQCPAQDHHVRAACSVQPWMPQRGRITAGQVDMVHAATRTGHRSRPGDHQRLRQLSTQGRTPPCLPSASFQSGTLCIAEVKDAFRASGHPARYAAVRVFKSPTRRDYCHSPLAISFPLRLSSGSVTDHERSRGRQHFCQLPP